MNRHVLILLAAIATQPGLAVAATGEEEMSDTQKMRFCERVRDHALQAFYNRERGRPMKLFEEDGGDGARITNHVIKRVYEEPQISSPRRAETYGRATCNEMMGTKPPSN